MAVAFDAKSTADTVSGTAVTTFTQTNLTIGASANALTYIAIFSANVSSITAHWDSTGTNQAMTVNFLWNATAGVGVAICTLLNPTTGAKTFSISWTTSAQVTVCGVSWTGAASFGAYTTNTGTATTSTVTPAGAGANDQMIAGHGSSNGPTFSAPNGTSVFIENSTPASYTCGGNRLAGPSAALTFTMSTSSPFLSGGIAIKAPAATQSYGWFADAFAVMPRLKLPTWEQGPWAFKSPPIGQPYTTREFFDAVRYKLPRDGLIEFPKGTDPAIVYKPSWDLIFEPLRRQKVLDGLEAPRLGTDPPIAVPFTTDLFAEPFKKLRPLDSLIEQPLGTDPALSNPRIFDVFFDRLSWVLRGGGAQVWDFLPPTAVVSSSVESLPNLFDALRLLKVSSEGMGFQAPGTSPVIGSVFSTLEFLQHSDLKQPLAGLVDVEFSFISSIAALASWPWFDVVRSKLPIVNVVDNVPPFLPAPVLFSAPFEGLRLIQPRERFGELEFAIVAILGGAPFDAWFDELRKMQVRDVPDWTSTGAQVVNTVEFALTEWFARTRLIQPLVETPLVVNFPPGSVTPTAIVADWIIRARRRRGR